MSFLEKLTEGASNQRGGKRPKMAPEGVMANKPGRIPCVNPMCRRTASRDKFGDDEIICGKCMRMAKPETREAWRRLWRRDKKLQRLIARRAWFRTGQAQRLLAVFEARRQKLWKQMADEATNAMVGI